MPNEGYVTTADGPRLFFRKTGHGTKTLIVLNGFYLFDDFEYLARNRTVVFVDLRNRGRSDYVTDSSKLNRGVLNDVDDIETVRRWFDAESVDLLAHSYAAKTVVLYAMEHGAHVGRIVQIGAPAPDENRQYPAHLTGADTVMEDFAKKAGKLQRERHALTPEEFCRRFWSLLRVVYFVNPADAPKVRWDRCDLATELNLMDYWLRYLLPSIRSISPTAADLARVAAPVLVVHGTRDRSAPYGAAREWAMTLPNARLLAVDNAAHAPWIEAPETVLAGIQTFLDGSWPDSATEVDSL